MYGFKNLRKIISEFKDDFVSELRTNKDDDESQSAVEVEIGSEDDDGINFRNKHYSFSGDSGLERIEEEDDMEKTRPVKKGGYVEDKPAGVTEAGVGEMKNEEFDLEEE
jgi:hypothetical protein